MRDLEVMRELEVMKKLVVMKELEVMWELEVMRELEVMWELEVMRELEVMWELEVMRELEPGLRLMLLRASNDHSTCGDGGAAVGAGAGEAIADRALGVGAEDITFGIGDVGVTAYGDDVLCGSLLRAERPRVRNPAMNTSCFSFRAVSSHLSRRGCGSPGLGGVDCRGEDLGLWLYRRSGLWLYRRSGLVAVQKIWACGCTEDLGLWLYRRSGLVAVQKIWRKREENEREENEREEDEREENEREEDEREEDEREEERGAGPSYGKVERLHGSQLPPGYRAMLIRVDWIQITTQSSVHSYFRSAKMPYENDIPRVVTVASVLLVLRVYLSPAWSTDSKNLQFKSFSVPHLSSLLTLGNYSFPCDNCSDFLTSTTPSTATARVLTLSAVIALQIVGPFEGIMSGCAAHPLLGRYSAM
ncbi:hypothetical protein FHG87_002252 [Trinorchestia longiramus]|nr:hypothetical protein FHG87_002252 [Trinorchestia longiramus]